MSRGTLKGIKSGKKDVLASKNSKEDRQIDFLLRPASWNDFVGQERIKNNYCSLNKIVEKWTNIDCTEKEVVLESCNYGCENAKCKENPVTTTTTAEEIPFYKNILLQILFILSLAMIILFVWLRKRK